MQSLGMQWVAAEYTWKNSYSRFSSRLIARQIFAEVVVNSKEWTVLDLFKYFDNFNLLFQLYI
jgi:hypothetical protein